MTPKLFTIGNLHNGTALAVVAHGPFGTRDIFGPFSTRLEASNAAHDVAAAKLRYYDSIEVVEIEFKPTDCKRIVADSATQYGYTYAT